ncbi:MAG: acetylglutamate kinase [Chloroflexota bacterium]|nr:acetylglutamate kinase [Dehalococcoidia bacterium]MDW8254409.1 acetylglutamate kinase [Chloroflexota bacterium]
MADHSQRPIVVKLGGSTLGDHDTSLADLAALARAGLPVVVVHGGGKAITEWLRRLGAPTRFVRGLRVTDAMSLEVVLGVLGGLVNTQLVAELGRAGAPAVGLTGADGGLLLVEPADPELGFVGAIAEVRPAILRQLLDAGLVPVVAPIGLGRRDGALYNLNADTAAGAIAAALEAERLIFLTDVAGVRGADGSLLPALDPVTARALIDAGVIASGMIPKVEAGLAAGRAVIADGRLPGALGRALREESGTLVLGAPTPSTA